MKGKRRTNHDDIGKRTIAALARFPSLRVALGLATVILLPLTLSFGVVKPAFGYLFPDDPAALMVRRGLQLAIILGSVYLAIRLVRLRDSRTRTAALTRMLVGAAAILLLPTVVLNGLLSPLLSHIIPGVQLPRAAGELLMIPCVVLLYSLLFRFYEVRDIHELSRDGCVKEMGVGFVCGISIPSLTILFLFLGGHYSVVSVNPVSVLAYALASVAFLSCHEELFFRGVIYRICETGLGTHVAIVLSAAVFGAAHLANQHISLAGLVSATTGGALLGVLFTLSGRLWLPISFHFGWNLCQVFFGSNVSGVAEYGSFLENRLEGSDLLTGGDFGIETSLPLLILLFTLTVFLYRQVVKRGRVVHPSWRSDEPDTVGVRRY